MNGATRALLPTPSPSVPRHTEEYWKAKAMVLASAVVGEKRKATFSPSAKEARVFDPVTKFYLPKSTALPEGNKRIKGVTVMHGSMMTSELPGFRIKEAEENAEIEKSRKKKVQDLRALYNACAKGCSCTGEKCAAAGFYLCQFCCVLKKKRCGVKKCKEDYLATACTDMPLPKKPKPPKKSNVNPPEHDVAGDGGARDSDSDSWILDSEPPPLQATSDEGSEEEEDDEEDEPTFHKGDEVEVRCDGVWYGGHVTNVRWVNGSETVDCFHPCDSYRTEVEVVSGDIRHYEESEDEDVPLAYLKTT
jgi:hypothetical protein